MFQGETPLPALPERPQTRFQDYDIIKTFTLLVYVPFCRKSPVKFQCEVQDNYYTILYIIQKKIKAGIFM